MNIEQLYRDHNIRFVTEGHKHAREGWVNVECPFCTGNPGYHLGYDTIGNKFVCWRCGGKHADQVISKLLRVGTGEAKTLLRQYGSLVHKVPEKRAKIGTKRFKLPPHTQPLAQAHRNYLEDRGFAPDLLIDLYGLQGTGIYSRLDNIDYSRRIVIPYMWGDEIVSFDCRDITNKSQYKYMACSEAREKINHKHILYGSQPLWGDTGICVEGCTDVWRMGVNSFATSGIKYTPKQLRLIAKTFKRVPVLFDPDPQGIKQANKLISDLKFRGVDSFRVDIETDPGDLTQTEADYLVKQLI